MYTKVPVKDIDEIELIGLFVSNLEKGKLVGWVYNGAEESFETFSIPSFLFDENDAPNLDFAYVEDETEPLMQNYTRNFYD